MFQCNKMIKCLCKGSCTSVGQPHKVSSIGGEPVSRRHSRRTTSDHVANCGQAAFMLRVEQTKNDADRIPTSARQVMRDSVSLLKVSAESIRVTNDTIRCERLTCV